MTKVHKMRSAVTALTELFDAKTEHHVSVDCLSGSGAIHKSKGGNKKNWMCHCILPAPGSQQFQMSKHKQEYFLKKRSQTAAFPNQLHGNGNTTDLAQKDV
jgi:hypothetical protein